METALRLADEAIARADDEDLLDDELGLRPLYNDPEDEETTR